VVRWAVWSAIQTCDFHSRIWGVCSLRRLVAGPNEMLHRKTKKGSYAAMRFRRYALLKNPRPPFGMPFTEGFRMVALREKQRHQFEVTFGVQFEYSLTVELPKLTIRKGVCWVVQKPPWRSRLNLYSFKRLVGTVQMSPMIFHNKGSLSCISCKDSEKSASHICAITPKGLVDLKFI
jgi:hypothetical protein